LAEQTRLVRVLPDLRSPLTGLFFAYPAQKFAPARVKRLIAFSAIGMKRMALHL
jgi:hypothetical protein